MYICYNIFGPITNEAQNFIRTMYVSLTKNIFCNIAIQPTRAQNEFGSNSHPRKTSFSLKRNHTIREQSQTRCEIAKVCETFSSKKGKTKVKNTKNPIPSVHRGQKHSVCSDGREQRTRFVRFANTIKFHT